jgi:DNA-binding NtrC family response regulator
MAKTAGPRSSASPGTAFDVRESDMPLHERPGALPRREPTPRDWPELERIEHAVAWFDAEGRCLRDNSAFRRRRAGLDGLGWVLGAESRRAALEAIRRVASGAEASAAIEMAAPDDRWELLAVHAVGDRPGTVLLELQDVTRRRLEERRLEAESAEVRALVGQHGPTDRPSGTRRVPPARWIDLALATDAPVLIVGERGSGKDWTAREIHARGERAAGPFVEVRCASVDPVAFLRDVLGEGVARRASATPQPTAVERARGGTLHLSGIDELPAALQLKLSRILKEDTGRVIRWVGSASLGAAGAPPALIPELRDLLAVVEVHVPPLRERLDELPVLLRALMGGFTRATVSPEAAEVIKRHDWPGNLRELSNVVARATLHAERRQREGEAGTRDGVAVVTAADVEQVLAQSQWNMKRAAATLGISRSTLYVKLRRHHIEPPDRQRGG